MSTQPPDNATNNQTPVPPTNLSPREQRRAARQQRRAERLGSGGGTWVGGAIFILIGVILLAQNLGTPVPGNWWALFILLPAVGSFGAAWNVYNASGGQVSGRVIGSLIAGLFFTGLTVALYFNFDLTWAGPLALILLGIGVFASAWFRPTPP